MQLEWDPETIHQSEKGYAWSLLYLLSVAQKKVCLFDPDLSRGEILSRAVSEQIQLFFNRSTQGQLTIVMHNVHFFEQRGARLQQLYQTYAHRMQIRITDARAHQAQDPFLIVDDIHVLHRFHCQQSRFRYYLSEPRYVTPLSDRFQELLDLAPTLLPTVTLGL